jgi:hypothetical protein
MTGKSEIATHIDVNIISQRPDSLNRITMVQVIYNTHHKYYHIKLKLQLFHYTPLRRLGERRYSSYPLSTSTLDGGEWSASSPGRALSPGKGPPVPIVQEAV